MSCIVEFSYIFNLKHFLYRTFPLLFVSNPYIIVGYNILGGSLFFSDPYIIVDYNFF